MPVTRFATALVALCLVASSVAAQRPAEESSLLRMETESLGDTVGGVATRVTLRYIEAELRSQYLLGYYMESRNAGQSYRKIDVEVPGRRGVTIRSIRGYIQ